MRSYKGNRETVFLALFELISSSVRRKLIEMFTPSYSTAKSPQKDESRLNGGGKNSKSNTSLTFYSICVLLVVLFQGVLVSGAAVVHPVSQAELNAQGHAARFTVSPQVGSPHRVSTRYAIPSSSTPCTQNTPAALKVATNTFSGTTKFIRKAAALDNADIKQKKLVGMMNV